MALRITAHDQYQSFWRLYLTVLLSLIIIYFFSVSIDHFPLTIVYSIFRFFGVSIVIIHFSWFLTRLIRRYSQRSYESPKNRAVLITGCDSGFGNSLCEKLDQYGFTVFAGCLFPNGDGAEKLRSNCSNKIRVIKLDVTNNEDVQNVVNEITKSGLDLWAVVNNAGIGGYSLTEWGKDIDNFERIFAVNLFGVIRVTKMCLPLLRLSHGRVINMASIAGRFTFVGTTAYSMTKYGVRSFSDGLRREITRFGVKVITLEPALYKTAITDPDILSQSIDKLWKETDPQIQRSYGGDEFKQKFICRLKETVKLSRPQLHEVIDAQMEAVIISDPDCYYQCGGTGEKIGSYILEMVSDLAQDYALIGKTWITLMQFGAKFNKN